MNQKGNMCVQIVDGVGFVDSRPSTDYHNQFKKYEKKEKNTGDMCNMICDMWHMTYDTWQVAGVKPSH